MEIGLQNDKVKQISNH